MPKKQAKNAYFWFMLEFKKNQERRGNNISLKNVSEMCSEKWKRLSASQKSKYEAMAKNNKSDPGERYTSLGVSFSLIEKVKKEEAEAHNQLQSKLVNVVQSGEQNSLKFKEFVFITFNYFCRDTLGNYIPAEIGIIKFSLCGGVQNNKLHLMINPRVLPLGSAFEAKEHSKNTHRLKPPPSAVGEKNFDTIFEEIRNFINPTNEPDFPLLYTMSDHIACVTSILKQLAVEICHDEKEASEMFTICSIDELFFQLKKNTSEPLSSQFMAKILLDKDHYEHSSGLACGFHDEEDIPKYCAQAMVTRWAYTVCDNICGSLDIKLIPGKHVPMRSDVNYKLIKPGDEGDPTNVWNKIPAGKKNKLVPTKISESIVSENNPVVYETIYVNGIPRLHIKGDETPILVENPFARNGHSSKDIKNEESSSEDDEKPVISIKEESVIRDSVLLENPFAVSKIKQEPEEEVFTYCEENPFARKELKVDPNSFYGLVKQLREIHDEESDDESNGVPGSIVYEDRIGQTTMKRRLSADGTEDVKREPSPLINSSKIKRER